MSNRARQIASRCFALARSTTFAAERETAIARGLAICSNAGLDPDEFDIPGRAKSRRRRPGEGIGDDYVRASRAERPTDPGTFYRAGDRAPQHYSREELSELTRRYQAHMVSGDFRFTADVRAAMDEFAARAADAGSAFAAGFERGRFDAAMRRRNQRDEQLKRWPEISDVVSYLFSRGSPVYDMGDDDDTGARWFVPGKDKPLTDRDLRDLADQVAA